MEWWEYIPSNKVREDLMRQIAQTLLMIRAGQEEKADLSEIGRKVDLLMKTCYLEGLNMMRKKIEAVFKELDR